MSNISKNINNVIGLNISTGGLSALTATIGSMSLTTITITNTTIPNLVSTNISGGTLNLSNGITTANINFTGTFSQNGIPYIGSQWSGTTGTSLFYGTSGNVFVGIGTSNPGSSLDVNGRINSSALTSSSSTIGNSYFTNISTSTLQAPGGLTAGNINFTGSLFQNGAVYTVNSQWTGTSGNTLFFGSTGSVNVGIGTTAPTVTLDVAGTVRANIITTGTLQVTNSITTGTLQATGGITTSNLNFTGTLNQNGSPYLASQWTGTTGTLFFGSTGSVNVGIGTTAPTVTLDVAGTTRTINLVSTTSTLASIVSTTITTGTLQATSGITTSNINFTGALFQNGSIYTASQWTGTAGTLFFGSTGSVNVGIGTTNPTVTLDINGTTRTSNFIGTTSTLASIVSTTITTGTLQASNGITVGNINFTGTINQNGSPYIASQWTGTSGSTLFYGTGTSNVGINTTNPIFNLDVTGTARITVGITTGSITSVSLTTDILQATTITSGNIRIAGTGQLSIINPSAGVVNDTIVFGQGSGNNNTGILNYNYYSNSSTVNSVGIGLSSNNNTLVVNAGGQIGINTSNPQFNLDVNGNARITNSITTNNLTVTAGMTGNSILVNSLTAGSLLVTGNMTVGGNLFIAGTLTSVNVTNSNVIETNVTNGTLNVIVGITTTNLLVTQLSSMENLFSTRSTLTNVITTNISTGSLTAITGLVATSSFGGVYSGAIITDYSNGIGRISVGASDNIQFYTGGPATTPELTISSSGNVGINTTSPVTTLDISGTTRIAGNTTVGGNLIVNGSISAGSYFLGLFTAGNVITNNVNYGISNVYSGSFAAANNVSASTPISNLQFQNVGIAGFTVTLNVAIITSPTSGNLYSTFTLEGNQNNSGWTLITSYLGDNTGIAFTITPNTGQINYTSTNVSGWVSNTFRYSVTSISNTGTYSSLLNPTQASFVINTIQLNNTSIAVAGSNTGALYTLGGVTISQNLQIYSTTDTIAVGSGGSLTVLGGAAISKGLIVGGAFTSGAILITAGGLQATFNSNTLGSLFTTDGNVGINIVPTYRFDINTANTPIALRVIGSNVDSSVIRFENTSTGGSVYHVGSTGIGSAAGTGFSIYDLTSTTTRVIISSSGNVGINNINPSTILDVTGNVRITNGNLLATGNSNTLGSLFTTGGNVGINTTAPGAGLDVSGNENWGIIRLANMNNPGSNTPIGFFYDSTFTPNGNATTGNWSVGTGAVGLGTSTFNIYRNGQNSNTFTINSAGNIGIRTNSQTTALGVDGAIVATGDITAFGSISDKRLKENILPISTAIEKILQLNPVTFDWKHNITNESYRGKSDSGFIAQEIEQVIPHSVSEFQDLVDGKEYKCMRHERIIPYLVKAIQELVQKNIELESKLN